VEEYLAEASKLLEKVRELTREEKRILAYFVENISVGELRAVKELKQMGIGNPQTGIRKLVTLGLLEEGRESYSLAKPLRTYIAKRGKTQILNMLAT
jgi:hypothetical protein